MTVLAWVALSVMALMVCALAALILAGGLAGATWRDRLVTPTRVPSGPHPHQQALPVDPTHPPSWKNYDPRPDAPPRSCTCHPDRHLVPGQRVLWWPVPNSGGVVNLYCQDGVELP